MKQYFQDLVWFDFLEAVSHWVAGLELAYDGFVTVTTPGSPKKPCDAGGSHTLTTSSTTKLLSCCQN